MLERFPPTRLGPNDMNLTSLYKPPSTAPDFVFNPRRMSQEEAEAYCQTLGGHLAAYISKTEQYLVEQTLVNKVGAATMLMGCCCSELDGACCVAMCVCGCLFTPTEKRGQAVLAHTMLPCILQGFLVSVSNPQYWIGLQADGWPNFKWSDSMVPSPLEKGGYSNWGTYYNPNKPDQMYVAEPNNLRPSEYCAVGNHTEGTGKPFTWAWADTSCLNSFVSICRINREQAALTTAAA